MNQSELEEIESHLYSQIYHSSQADNQENDQVVLSTQADNNIMRRPNRYFQNNRLKHKNSPGNKYYKKRFGQPSYHSHSAADNTSNYSKDYGGRSQSVGLNKLIVLAPQERVEPPNKRIAKVNHKKHAEVRRTRPVTKPKTPKPKGEVIVLSDSAPEDDDEDSCVVVPPVWPQLNVDDDSDDDENKSKCRQVGLSTLHKSTDDVVFIEPKNVPEEIINLDDESQSQQTPSSKNTNSYHPNERKELLNTPDSTSNDFISGNVATNQTKFNFALHGSDFKMNEFVKPIAKANETCETESSSSTTDLNNVKAIVFNVVEFPKDDNMFAEPNLETFGNFITPTRNKTSENELATSSDLLLPSSSNVLDTYNSPPTDSDSSDSENATAATKSRDSKEKRAKTPEIAKKVMKKPLGLSSKYDLIMDETKRRKSLDATTKKKIKAKKKRNDTGDGEPKKRKSLSEDDSSNTNARKKLKSTEIETKPIENQVASIKNKQSEDDCEISKKKRRKSESSSTETTVHNENSINITTIKEEDPRKEIYDSYVEEVRNSENQIVDHIKVKTETSGLNKDIEAKARSEDNQNDLSFSDLQILDETFASATDLSDDNESILSELAKEETHDIQLGNCKDSINVKLEAMANRKTELVEPERKISLTNSSVRDLQKLMSNNPDMWQIRHDDVYQVLRAAHRKRCVRCREFGHLSHQCRTIIILKCKLCGEQGHLEPRCRNKRCTQCGRSSKFTTTYCKSCFHLKEYICNICRMYGHLENMCPDLWRRYHLTVTDGPPQQPNVSIESSEMSIERRFRWCAGCAQEGHLEHMCPCFQSHYPRIDPYVKCYEDVVEPNANVEEVNAVAGTSTNKLPIHCRLGPPVGNNERPVEFNFQDYVVPPLESNPPIPSLLTLQLPTPENFTNVNNLVENNSQQQVYFENNLPSFITVDNSQSKQSRRAERIILYGPTNQVVGLFNRAFKQLHLTKRRIQFIKNNLQGNRREEYMNKPKRIATLNMIFFGICLKNDGQMHLDRLKRVNLNDNLPPNYRQLLLFSYKYIFGTEKHVNFNYNAMSYQI